MSDNENGRMEMTYFKSAQPLIFRPVAIWVRRGKDAAGYCDKQKAPGNDELHRTAHGEMSGEYLSGGALYRSKYMGV